MKNVDDRLVGFCDSETEKERLWRAISLSFKLRRSWNVVQAFMTGIISMRECVFAFQYPAHVVGVAKKPTRGGGILLICPAAVKAEFGE